MTEHGYFDAFIDEETGDLATTQGFESAFIISFFTDKRADQSEVKDPMERRGWIGDPHCNIHGGYGSKHWLYQQSRLDGDYERGMYFSTIDCLQWMVAENYAVSVDAKITFLPENRGAEVVALIEWPDGNITNYGWNIWQNTPYGSLV